MLIVATSVLFGDDRSLIGMPQIDAHRDLSTRSHFFLRGCWNAARRLEPQKPSTRGGVRTTQALFDHDQTIVVVCRLTSHQCLLSDRDRTHAVAHAVVCRKLVERRHGLVFPRGGGFGLRPGPFGARGGDAGAPVQPCAVAKARTDVISPNNTRAPAS